MSKSTAISGPDRAHKGDGSAARFAMEALPQPLAGCIASIIKAARLWKSEREEVMRELTAHAQDAIKAGRDPQEIVASMGDPVTVGRLLRRSSRRKRPLAWQIWRRSKQALGLAVLVVVVGYAGLFVRFYVGSPTINYNYIAELNERGKAFSEDQHALPAYNALQQAWARELKLLEAAKDETEQTLSQSELNELRWAHENIPRSTAEYSNYDLLLEAHERLRPLIDEAVRASNRPVLGVLYSDRHEQTVSEDGVWTTTILPPSEDPAEGGSLVGVLLPWLTETRKHAQLFAFDAMLAARNGEPERAVSSLSATFNTARLIGQEHTLIASLVAMAVQTMGEDVLLRMLHEHPGLLNAQHLRDLAHAIASSSQVTQRLDFATEKRMFRDMLQRVYTLEADGDGRLTPKAMELLNQFIEPKITYFSDNMVDAPTGATQFAGPVAMVAYGSRRDQEEMYDRLISLAEAMLQESPGSAAYARLHERHQALASQLQDSARYWMVERLAPAFGRSVSSAHSTAAHTDATLVVIALHVHHQQTGQWPQILSELTPGLLPRIPDDLFDPAGQIKYRVIDNTPFVYFIGSNGVDDGGTHPKSASLVRGVRSFELRYGRGYPYGLSSDPTVPENQADWVIYPPHPES